jgi:hypothetical protein
MLSFFVLEDDSADKPLQLLDFISSTNITETDATRKFKLLFSKRINYAHTLRVLELANYKNKTFNILISCDYGINMSIVECQGGFHGLKAGKYLIKEINYIEPTPIYPSRNMYIRVYGELNLINIKGNANRGWSALNLQFSKLIDAELVSDFSLFNETRANELFTPYINKSAYDTLSVNFDFTFMSVGKYHLGMKYNGVEYNFSNIFLNITDNESPHFWNLKNTVYSLINPKRKTKS